MTERSKRAKPHLRFPEPWMRLFVHRLSVRWQAPSIAKSLTVEYSSRLTRSLGRASLANAKVSLSSKLEHAPREIVREVLAHEIAHVVVAKLSARKRRPHGSEWRELMRLAKFEPRRRVPFGTREAPVKAVNDVFIHSCPVCHAARRARRPVRGWRCVMCVENGLDGRLEIERVHVR